MMRGARGLWLLVAILWLPFVAAAQQPGKVWRIGVLIGDRPGAVEAFVDGLRELNYIEGTHFVLETRRFARQEQLSAFAAELVRLQPDVIVAGHGVAALALKSATKTIPIVMSSSNDAVGQGVVASLARPGGNITGVTNMAPDVVAKRVELLKEAVPRASRIAVVGCPHRAGGGSGGEWLAVQPAAHKLGLDILPILIRRSDELTGAFASAMQQKFDAVLVLECALYPRPEQVTAVVNQARVPAIYSSSRQVNGGGLMSYGPNPTLQYRRAATFVDKILRGAKPADLPVEQPAALEFVVNLKTMRAFGLTIPKTLLMRADSFIE